ncbi:hypothetical protein C6Y08_15405 [Lactiplantibacillus pentosus]|uniref:Uncharacterized protein n=1 Tax=Lactiplantibacillus pentosus TaxID=1589 RepID=A0ABX5CW65_LACPE|nr:hypothetical protein C6Y08_15405 [Lactiplantibacillus pentosus]
MLKDRHPVGWRFFLNNEFGTEQWHWLGWNTTCAENVAVIEEPLSLGITPVYTGKRKFIQTEQSIQKDHPRIHGE